MRKNSISANSDPWLLIITVILIIFGTLMVFSSTVIMAETRFHRPYLFLYKQLMWVSIGFVIMYLFSRFDYSKLQKLSKPVIIATVLLLIAVLVVGTSRGGAKRWLIWGPVNFQPSELAKIGLIIALADYLDRKKSKLGLWKGTWPVLLAVASVCGLIGLEPDLGTPILIFSVTVSLLFISHANFKYLALAIILAVPLVIFEIFRKSYRLERFKAYLANWGDIKSVSFQLDQSLIALGSGGFFGKGLGQGQMKLMHIPEPHTDFIFPIIGEEWGFLGAVTVIALFLVFAWRGLQISRNSRDFFGSLLAAGITLMILLQALINIGVTCGMLPTKGLPLPFVSFGGSALVINMAEVGILLNISKSGAKR